MELENIKDLKKTLQTMPKVELHAHLNGSINEKVLQTLLPSKENVKPSRTIDAPQRNLTKCWEAFKKIHDVITTPEILYRATCLVIEEFSKDNVVYLELRSTPKQAHLINSKDEYIQSVVRAIRDTRKTVATKVKFLVSIDRGRGLSEGMENILLTEKWIKLAPDIVKGVDISGDPNTGHYEWLLSLMEAARERKIPTACHLPEVINALETKKFMLFKPERIAHGQFLHPQLGGTEELWNLTRELKIPIEVCITSNLVSGVSPSMDKHYIKQVFDEGLPFVLCTDDCGVFNTTLSVEYQKFVDLCKVTPHKLKEVCIKSIDYSFASDSEKAEIRRKIASYWDDIGKD